MRACSILAAALAVCAGAQVRELAEAARAFPPEFAADAIVRLAARSAEPVPWKRGQLEEAFQLALSARQPLKGTAANGAAPRSLNAFAAALNLDALSLQSRAVVEMARVDGGRARELFAGIVVPPVARLECGAALPDVAAYYEALAAVIHSGFTAEQRRRGQPVQLLMGTLHSMTSILHAAPAARVLASLPLRDEEFEAAAAIFAGALGEIPADGHAFAAALERDGLLTQVSNLAGIFESRRIPAEAFARNLRRLLVTQLTAPQCSENAGHAAAVLAWFNARFASAASPLTAEETAPARIETPPRPAAAPGNPEVALTLRRFRLMNPRDAGWGNTAQQIVEQILSEESRAPAFHRTSALFQAFLALLPSGRERDAALDRYARWLADSPVRRADPVGWYCHAEALASFLRSAGQAELLRRFETSGDGLLAFQSRVRAAAPEPAPQCPPGSVCGSVAAPDAMRAELVAFLLN